MHWTQLDLQSWQVTCTTKLLDWLMINQSQKVMGLKRVRFYALISNDRPDLDARIAMTQVTGDNPMVGILKLRELAEENPGNLEAQYNLGLLSIQSGQYDRAVERFSKVIDLDPDNIEGYFYLGVSYLEMGNDQKAKENFNYVAKNGNDPAVIKLVEDYLIKINLKIFNIK